jgi:hypothetical protein
MTEERLDAATRGRFFRLTRKGVLMVELMPRYHGQPLNRAVNRIMSGKAKDKFERCAVEVANAEPMDDPLIPLTPEVGT